jgi:hypothetical protein
LKIKLKDTVEVMEAELQAMLNTLTEHNFLDAFKKNDRSAGNCAYVWNGTTTRVMVATSPVNYGYHAGITGDNT